jgi:hypothetical protein
MRALRAWRSLPPVLLAAALVVAGCSGDDDDDVGTAANDASASSVTSDPAASTVAAATAPNATATSTGATTTGSTAVPTETAPGATGSTAAPAGGNGPLATRDLAGQDLCPVLSSDEVSAVVGVPIGLAEFNPSYQDPNCVYYKAEAGVSVSVTKSAADHYDSVGAQAEPVSGVGDGAKWSARELTLFVQAKGATLTISVFQVGQPGAEKDAAVAVAEKVIQNL